MMSRVVEIILVTLEFLAGRLGFALVPVEDAERLACAEIPYRLAEGGTS